MIRKNFLSILMAATLILAINSLGQNSTPPPSSDSAQANADQNIELLRKDIRSQKKQIIAANLQLTDTEAVKFWPLYDQYTADLVKINDAKYAAIKEYAMNFDTLTDEKALSLMRQILEVDQSVAQLRLKYAPLFSKIVSGKKTALFFQMDRRLVMLIDLQLAAQIPMVQP